MEAFKSAFTHCQLDEGHHGYYGQPYSDWQLEKTQIWELLIDRVLDCTGADQAWYHLRGDTLEEGILQSVGFLSGTQRPFYVDAIRCTGGVGYVNGQMGVQISRDTPFPRSLLQCSLEFAGLVVHAGAVSPEVASEAAGELFAGARPAGLIAFLHLCKWGEWIELLVAESSSSMEIEAAIERTLRVLRP
jgi:hypothetical protein